MTMQTKIQILLAIAAAAAFAQQPVPPRGGPPDGRLPKLPAAITSFGAAVADGVLYVYGGHIGKAHAHTRENLADSFARLDLAHPREWETLPMRQKLQGLALVAWRGQLIRLGGVAARNAKGEPTDMHSTAEVERFDPATKTWTTLTPLPEPRSSFDAVVQGDKLYVIGGWRLSGGEETGVWAEQNYVADLTQEPLVWQPLPPATFRQRALAVAATSRYLYAIGGLTPAGEGTPAVQIFDLEKQTWSRGPDLPASGATKAFGAAAWGLGETVWASASDGRVFALEAGAGEWRDVQFTLATPRFFHRILPHPKGSLLFLGGAGKSGHLDTIENIEITTLNAPPAGALPASPQAKTAAAGQANWPGFRGAGDNHTSARDLPVHWSDTENLRWSAALTGTGQSSPVVWGARVFVTSVVGENKEKVRVECFDLATGQGRWVQEFPASTTQSLSDYISKAAPTPCVDAERLYAFFETGDLRAFDHDGQPLWQRSLTREFGEFKGNHGVGASLAQSADAIFALIDHDGPSYLLALDKQTGATRWKLDREPHVSWSSPLVAEREIVLSTAGSVEGIDVASGARRWFVTGLKMNTVPSPTLAGDLVLAGSSERGHTVAIRRGGIGDVTATHVAWRAAEASCNFSSPLVHGQRAYVINKAGVLFALDLVTGGVRWSLRLPDSCWATPLAAGDLLYFFGKGGATTVLRDLPEGPQRVAESKLTITGRVYGLAAVDGALLLRTDDRLICLGSPDVGLRTGSR
jgi:outer membrane protein assembly factor BamB